MNSSRYDDWKLSYPPRYDKEEKYEDAIQSALEITKEQAQAAFDELEELRAELSYTLEEILNCPGEDVSCEATEAIEDCCNTLRDIYGIDY